MRLEGKSAIVTGAASGIGRATATLLASEGANVVAVDLSGTALEEAHGANAAIKTVFADVAREGAAEEIVRTAVAHGSGLDVVVNNAGTGSNALAEVLPLQEW